MATHHLTTPLTDEAVAQLRSGDVVFLSGTIYTARDAAHRRLAESLDRGEGLPFDLRGAVIYYVGPSPAPPDGPSVPPVPPPATAWTATPRVCTRWD
ncbi:fumarate hydratase, class I [Desulfovibrio sp. A2]|nr:fumarate hydratase, class I [Desulfovibrio sp. A2]